MRYLKNWNDMKTPYIECTPKRWEIIKPNLEKWGYDVKQHISRSPVASFTLIIDFQGLGICASLPPVSTFSKEVLGNRYEVEDIDEFLAITAKIQGFTYVKEQHAIKDPKVFKPFDRILYYSSEEKRWVPGIFSHIAQNKFACIMKAHRRGVGIGVTPIDDIKHYEGNEHLCTENIDDYD